LCYGWLAGWLLFAWRPARSTTRSFLSSQNSTLKSVHIKLSVAYRVEAIVAGPDS
jgi:hypothetical protein